MKAKLLVEGKEFDIEILDPELQKLLAPNKKTGYERLEQGKTFYIQRSDGSVGCGCDHHNTICDDYYVAANYYSDKTVAENNARADRLMRQLRRFAAEHRVNNNPTDRYSIFYLKGIGLQLRRDGDSYLCGPWFDSQDAGAQAINEFHDELIWYFTEYKDSLRGE